MTETILIVDDEAPMRSFVKRNLVARKYQVIEAKNGIEGLAMARHEDPDLVILDIMMPHMDGYEMCRRLRAFSDVPVIVLTAMVDENEIVAALDCGADDCLTKPFGVSELLARVRSVLRRSQHKHQHGESKRITYRDLTVDISANRAWIGDDELSLTRTEFTALRLYATNLGRTLPHSLVLSTVWGEGYECETHYVRIYVSRLRNKIEVDDGEPYFKTERGLGYRLGD